MPVWIIVGWREADPRSVIGYFNGLRRSRRISVRIDDRIGKTVGDNIAAGMIDLIIGLKCPRAVRIHCQRTVFGVDRFTGACRLLFAGLVSIGKLENQCTISPQIVVGEEVVGAVFRADDIAALFNLLGFIIACHGGVIDDTNAEFTNGDITIAVRDGNTYRKVDLVRIAVVDRSLQFKGIAEPATLLIEGYLKDRIPGRIRGRDLSTVFGKREVQCRIIRSGLNLTEGLGDFETHGARAVITEIDDKRLRDGPCAGSISPPGKIILVQHRIQSNRGRWPVINFCWDGRVVICWLFWFRGENQFFIIVFGPFIAKTFILIIINTNLFIKDAVFSELTLAKFKIQPPLFSLVIASSLLLDIDRINRGWRIARRILARLNNRHIRRRRAFRGGIHDNADVLDFAACMNVGNRLVTAIIRGAVPEDFVKRFSSPRSPTVPAAATKNVLGAFGFRFVENSASSRRIRHFGSSCSTI